MLLRLYHPLLFRDLAAANGGVRNNALQLLVDAFPLQDTSSSAEVGFTALQLFRRANHSQGGVPIVRCQMPWFGMPDALVWDAIWPVLGCRMPCFGMAYGLVKYAICTSAKLACNVAEAPHVKIFTSTHSILYTPHEYLPEHHARTICNPFEGLQQDYSKTRTPSAAVRLVTTLLFVHSSRTECLMYFLHADASQHASTRPWPLEQHQ